MRRVHGAVYRIIPEDSTIQKGYTKFTVRWIAMTVIVLKIKVQLE